MIRGTMPVSGEIGDLKGLLHALTYEVSFEPEFQRCAKGKGAARSPGGGAEGDKLGPDFRSTMQAVVRESLEPEFRRYTAIAQISQDTPPARHVSVLR